MHEGPGGNNPRVRPGEDEAALAFGAIRDVSDSGITDFAIWELYRLNDYDLVLAVEVCAVWPAGRLLTKKKPPIFVSEKRTCLTPPLLPVSLQAVRAYSARGGGAAECAVLQLQVEEAFNLGEALEISMLAEARASEAAAARGKKASARLLAGCADARAGASVWGAAAVEAVATGGSIRTAPPDEPLPQVPSMG